MSDDLVSRLEIPMSPFGDGASLPIWVLDLMGEAAERIEELEANLAKAVELISLCREMQAQVAHRKDPLMVLIDTTLAELKGQDDE